MLEQSVYELVAAIGDDVLAGGCLELLNRLDHVRHGPASVLEATLGVFVSATRSLHHTIEGKEF